jgi:hypothetical protein
MFDAMVHVKALEAPTFKDVDGTIHYGRLVGTDTFLRIAPKLRVKDAKGNPDGPAINRAMKEIADLMFPPDRWRPWRLSVARRLWRLPPSVRMRAVYDFLVSQAKAMGMTPPELPLGTSPAETASSVVLDSPSPASPISGS